MPLNINNRRNLISVVFPWWNTVYNICAPVWYLATNISPVNSSTAEHWKAIAKSTRTTNVWRQFFVSMSNHDTNCKQWHQQISPTSFQCFTRDLTHMRCRWRGRHLVKNVSISLWKLAFIWNYPACLSVLNLLNSPLLNMLRMRSISYKNTTN